MAITSNPHKKQQDEQEAARFIAAAGRPKKDEDDSTPPPQLHLRPDREMSRRIAAGAKRLGIPKASFGLAAIAEKLEKMGL